VGVSVIQILIWWVDVPLRSSHTASRRCGAVCPLPVAKDGEKIRGQLGGNVARKQLSAITLASIVISEFTAPELELANFLPLSSLYTLKMAARFSIARVATQLTSSAARRPAAFACQRWQRPAAVERRLFSVSAAGMDCNCCRRMRMADWSSEGEEVHNRPRVD
jgi:hypothetical protein